MITFSLECLHQVLFLSAPDETVESGSFSDLGLQRLLGHCLDTDSKLRDITGEFTRIADLALKEREKDNAAKGMRGLKVRENMQNDITGESFSTFQIRNAVPYRKFENPPDNDRHYSVNEGYRQQQAELAAQQLQQQQQPHRPPPPPQSGRNKRFQGYVFRPFDGDGAMGGGEEDKSSDEE